MTRKLLLQKICPNVCINACAYIGCEHCEVKLNELLDEYDKQIIEQYKASTNLKDTIKEIHDNVAKEMYCKGIDDMCKAINVYSAYDEYDNVVDVLEIAEELKAGGK